jgi:Domain of unknown function (DUF4157)
MEYQRAMRSAQKEQSKTPSSSLRQTSLNHVTVHPLLELQRTIGNQAVLNLLRSQNTHIDASTQAFRESRFGHDFSQIPIHSTQTVALQTKLKVNQPGDPYEQEADRVSEQVMCMANPEASVSDEEDEVNRALRSKQSAVSGPSAVTDSPGVPPFVHAALNSGSDQPLDTTARAFMEPRFGHDFSKVRVRTDERAVESARSVNALAYTVGHNVVFGAGQYQPGTSNGQRLLAHELTHVIQQGARRVSTTHAIPIQRQVAPAEAEKQPPMWDALQSEFENLVAIFLNLNQSEALRGERSDLTEELSVLWSQIGGPGEKSGAELASLQAKLRAFEKRRAEDRAVALDTWATLEQEYRTERARLVASQEASDRKALDYLDAQYQRAQRRKQAAGNYVRTDDIIYLGTVMSSERHLQKGREATGRPAAEGSGDVSLYVGKTMTSEAALRQVYQRSAREISEEALRMIKEGTSVEDAARWANQARNDLKALIRSRGSPIVRGFAEARNIRKYGNKLGPTFEELIRQGKTPEDIIGSAGRASTKVNRVATKLKVGGRLLIAIDIAIVTWEVFSAPEGERLRTAVAGAAGIAGAAGVGWAGAKGGAAVGLWLGGPVGAGVGGVIGAIGGALFGGWLGRKAGEEVYDLVDDLVNPSSLDSDTDAREDAYIRGHAGPRP